MPINRPGRKLTALVLAGAAVAVATGTGTEARGAQSCARPVSAIADNQGHPSGVPPILRRARPSELAEIGRAEAQKRQRFYYDPPADARYSSAVLNVSAK
jgi:hypothetical protein